MFCSACGTQIREGNLFCENCGKRAVTVQQGTNPTANSDLNPKIIPKVDAQASIVEKTVSPWESPKEVEPQKEKMDLKQFFRRVLLVAIVIIGLIGVGFVINKISDYNRMKQPIEMELWKYISFDISGYNGNAEVVVNFDMEGFKSRYRDEFDKRFDISLEEFYYDCGLNNYTLSEEHQLYNGDEILYTCTGDYEKALEKYNVIIPETEITVGVHLLEESEVVNIFDYVYLEFWGNDGDGFAEICWIECPDWAETFQFYILPSGYLSNGDVVTLGVETHYESMQSLPEYYVLERSRQEYIVSGLK